MVWNYEQNFEMAKPKFYNEHVLKKIKHSLNLNIDYILNTRFWFSS